MSSNSDDKPEIIRDLYVCSDCAAFIANGDLTGLAPEEAEQRSAAIIAGCELAYAAGYMWAGPDCGEDGERHREFSTAPCACCESRLAGPRCCAAFIRRDDA